MHRMVPRLRKSYSMFSSHQSCWRGKIFYKFQHVSSLGFRKRNSSFIENLCTYHTKSKGWLYLATSVVPSSWILIWKGCFPIPLILSSKYQKTYLGFWDVKHCCTTVFLQPVFVVAFYKWFQLFREHKAWWCGLFHFLQLKKTYEKLP